MKNKNKKKSKLEVAAELLVKTLIMQVLERREPAVNRLKNKIWKIFSKLHPSKSPPFYWQKGSNLKLSSVKSPFHEDIIL